MSNTEINLQPAPGVVDQGATVQGATAQVVTAQVATAQGATAQGAANGIVEVVVEQTPQAAANENVQVVVLPPPVIFLDAFDPTLIVGPKSKPPPHFIHGKHPYWKSYPDGTPDQLLGKLFFLIFA